MNDLPDTSSTSDAEFRDTRVPSRVVIRDGKIIEGVVGGYGPWQVTPPLIGTFDGYLDGEYVSEPVAMTQVELRRQYDWAMARSDRKQWRPERVLA